MTEKPGFLQRVFGGESDRSAELAARQGGAEASAGENPAGAASLDEGLGLPVSNALARLMAVVEEPAEGEPMRPMWNALSARFRRSIDHEELIPTLDSLREVFGDAFIGNVNQFEQFLSALDSRLSASLGQLEASRDIGARQASNSDGMQDSLRSRMEQMRRDIDGASELDQLKSDMRGGIDSMAQDLEQARISERELEQEFERHLEQVIARVVQLDRDARDLEDRLHEHRRLAITDTLTQLPNREGLRTRLEAETERFTRYGHSLVLAMCDVDFFKMVNDTFGHLGGDAVLRRVAELLRKRLREVDMVARYGGEEFVIVMPETSIEAAIPVLESLRESIANELITYEGKSVSVTASFGVAALETGDTPEQALHRADAALYLAKNRGRNKVVRYGDAP